MFVKPKLQAGKEQEQPHPGATCRQFLLALNQLTNNLINPNRHLFFLDHDHHEEKKSDQPSQSQFLCGICFDDKPLSDMFKEGNCNHPFCTHCISKYVATQIHQNILKVICPDPNCSVELKPEYLHTILPSEVVDRWESLIVGSEKTYCPFKDCSVLLANDGGKAVTSAECPSCHRLFCAQCKVPWHRRMTCKKFQRVKRNKDEKVLDNKFFNLAKEENWKKCPKCTMFVQKQGGCEHIACRCGCNFCYICGKNWTREHQCKRWSPSYIIRSLHQRCTNWFMHANLRFSNRSAEIRR